MSIYGHGYMSDYYIGDNLDRSYSDFNESVSNLTSVVNSFDVLNESGIDIEVVDENKVTDFIKEKLSVIWKKLLKLLDDIKEAFIKVIHKISDAIKNVVGSKSKAAAKKADNIVKENGGTKFELKMAEQNENISTSTSDTIDKYRAAADNDVRNSNKNTTSTSTDTSKEIKHDTSNMILIRLLPIIVEASFGGKKYQSVDPFFSDINNSLKKIDSASKEYLSKFATGLYKDMEGSKDIGRISLGSAGKAKLDRDSAENLSKAEADHKDSRKEKAAAAGASVPNKGGLNTSSELKQMLEADKFKSADLKLGIGGRSVDYKSFEPALAFVDDQANELHEIANTCEKMTSDFRKRVADKSSSEARNKNLGASEGSAIVRFFEVMIHDYNAVAKVLKDGATKSNALAAKYIKIGHLIDAKVQVIIQHGSKVS